MFATSHQEDLNNTYFSENNQFYRLRFILVMYVMLIAIVFHQC